MKERYQAKHYRQVEERPIRRRWKMSQKRRIFQVVLLILVLLITKLVFLFVEHYQNQNETKIKMHDANAYYIQQEQETEYFREAYLHLANLKLTVENTVKTELPQKYDVVPLVLETPKEEQIIVSGDCMDYPEVEGMRLESEFPLGYTNYIASVEDEVAVATVIYCESRGEPMEGKIAVGATILNRYYSEIPKFKGLSIVEICTQPAQYSYYEVEYALLEENGCIEAARRALSGEDPTRVTFPETGALYFFNPDRIESSYQLQIREGITKQVIGHHHFHTEFNA